VETTRKRKSKIVAKLSYSRRESLELWRHFKFDILSASMEQFPELEEGAVLRIHHMVVDVISGPDGREFNGHNQAH
jgi:hypothetical protein